MQGSNFPIWPTSRLKGCQFLLKIDQGRSLCMHHQGRLRFHALKFPDLKFVISNLRFPGLQSHSNRSRRQAPKTASNGSPALALYTNANAGKRPRGFPTIHLPKNTNNLAITRNNQRQLFTAAAVFIVSSPDPHSVRGGE